MIKSTHFFIGIAVYFLFIGTAFAFQPFPDTGQTMCYDANNLEVSCDSIQPGDPYYGQDGHYQPRLPRSYTKLGQGGVVLSDNALHVDDGGPWIMTRDNVTGLIWEIKKNINYSDIYKWNDTQDVFIRRVNLNKFGGFDDWRLPTRHELWSLVHLGLDRSYIDEDFFPLMNSRSYWSSDEYLGISNLTWAWAVSLSGGRAFINSKSNDYRVVAVRSEHQVSLGFTDHLDGTVSDHYSGLMWQKCNSGQTWDNFTKTCQGTELKGTWVQAMEYAENLQLAGYKDWRLPNINELQTLVNLKALDPATYPPFTAETMSNNYWSSTSRKVSYGSSTSTNAMCINFSSGGLNSGELKSYSFSIRAVRGGQDWTKSTIRIYIEPDGAVDAGAQWRIKGTTVWRNSGSIATVPIGNHIIEFKVVPGWRPEGTITVTVQANKMISATGFYLEQAGIMPGVMMLLLDEE